MKTLMIAERLKWSGQMPPSADEGRVYTARISLMTGYRIVRERGKWRLCSWSYPGALVRYIGVYGSLDGAKRAARRDHVSFYAE